MKTQDEITEIVIDISERKHINLLFNPQHENGDILAYCDDVKLKDSHVVSLRFLIRERSLTIFIPNIIEDVVDIVGEPLRAPNGTRVFDIVNELNHGYYYGSTYISQLDGHIAYRISLPQEFITYDTVDWMYKMAIGMCEVTYAEYTRK